MLDRIFPCHRLGAAAAGDLLDQLTMLQLRTAKQFTHIIQQPHRADSARESIDLA